MPNIKPCLWFDGQAEEAVKFYTSIFKNSKIGTVLRWGKTGPGTEGAVLTIEFTLDGNEFVAMNGGPQFKFTEAISIMVDVDDQAELDRLWAALTEGGKEIECGWLKDRYGLCWQIVPRLWAELVAKGDAAAIDRMMAAMMTMVKMDIATLQKAYDGA